MKPVLYPDIFRKGAFHLLAAASPFNCPCRMCLPPPDARQSPAARTGSSQSIYGFLRRPAFFRPRLRSLFFRDFSRFQTIIRASGTSEQSPGSFFSGEGRGRVLFFLFFSGKTVFFFQKISALLQRAESHGHAAARGPPDTEMYISIPPSGRPIISYCQIRCSLQGALAAQGSFEGKT
jgi:hypothetical protein